MTLVPDELTKTKGSKTSTLDADCGSLTSVGLERMARIIQRSSNLTKGRFAFNSDFITLTLDEVIGASESKPSTLDVDYNLFTSISHECMDRIEAQRFGGYALVVDGIGGKIEVEAIFHVLMNQGPLINMIAFDHGFDDKILFVLGKFATPIRPYISRLRIVCGSLTSDGCRLLGRIIQKLSNLVELWLYAKKSAEIEKLEQSSGEGNAKELPQMVNWPPTRRNLPKLQKSSVDIDGLSTPNSSQWVIKWKKLVEAIDISELETLCISGLFLNVLILKLLVDRLLKDGKSVPLWKFSFKKTRPAQATHSDEIEESKALLKKKYPGLRVDISLK
ncbi:hypothetical protein BX616_010467 [Lobosporangium transversale]|uniref:Uncharacterized protein n=1 Tax=Lobosporangium transversale TaxID=64571 RepID=A0A1Y2G9F5_9FUNG|nr:hypothetical protein BCR41DRAFT_400854 [Lobosporangium transversale]KAF9911853.1 hypothetical protein BX616_010467 [Lobosporangium transversale]ORZ04834.1 hypothetical protein BCR41DRAFT_400854 [Lobosporangium transversale]|eukprot:XP_021876771.1 hypothetical protein BCR41DRAFT_400854 [Lobosporangium transversale]